MRRIYSAPPFQVKFSKSGPTGIIEALLMVWSMSQLLVFMSTKNMIAMGMFILIYALVSYYTPNLIIRLMSPIAATYLLVRQDVIRASFMIEGMEGMPKSTRDSSDKDKHKDKADEKEGQEIEANDDKTEKDEEKAEEKEGFSKLTQHDDDVNKSMDTLENAVDRLEGSFDRIMSIGSKLGIDKHLSQLGSSLDINAILNQKKKLTS